MKIIDGFVLRNIAGESIVVGEGIGQVDFNKIISLNESATYLWESVVDREFSVEDLAQLLIKEYEIDENCAATDAKKIADEWCKVGIIK
ncbi:MAG: PqqD family protein [Rikenellaceae bacterium]